MLDAGQSFWAILEAFMVDAASPTQAAPALSPRVHGKSLPLIPRHASGYSANENTQYAFIR